MNTVVISTSSLNSYGSRVLTSGIDIAQYQRNPVLLYMHRRYSREDAPIGRVENVRVDGDRLLGDLVFDEKDDFGKKVAQKWADGFLRMVSAGLSIVELSDDPKYLLPGQKRMTITKSKLDEVSVVDIGANDDAIALYNEAGGRITLSQGDNSPDLPLLKDSTNPNNKEVMNEKIALALGLSAEATDEQAVSAIAQLKAEVDQAKQLKLALINEQLASAVQSGKLPKEHHPPIGTDGSSEVRQVHGHPHRSSRGLQVGEPRRVCPPLHRSLRLPTSLTLPLITNHLLTTD